MAQRSYTVCLCLTPQEINHIKDIQRKAACRAGRLSRSGAARWLINVGAEAIRRDKSIALISVGGGTEVTGQVEG